MSELTGHGAITEEYYKEVEALKPALDKRRQAAKIREEKQAAEMQRIINNQKPVG